MKDALVTLFFDCEKGELETFAALALNCGANVVGWTYSKKFGKIEILIPSEDFDTFYEGMKRLHKQDFSTFLRKIRFD